MSNQSGVPLEPAVGLSSGTCLLQERHVWVTTVTLFVGFEYVGCFVGIVNPKLD